MTNPLNLEKYKTIVLDCDGVVLNSNQTKVDAYYNTAKRTGGTDAQAQAFVDYHIKLGSIPRNDKIRYYISDILKQPFTEEFFQTLMDTFTEILDETLMQCEVAPELEKLKQRTSQAKWMLMSGGDQEELRKIFPRRGLDHLFELGIYGGPTKKNEHLATMIADGTIQFPALFIGDSRFDHQASTGAGLDFVFVSDWTDMPDWQSYCKQHQVAVSHHLELQPYTDF
jgi:phosphoglycolate phosphatase-like HAD superfamily hydrolase